MRETVQENLSMVKRERGWKKLENHFGVSHGFLMASLILKNIPKILHAQLKREAVANFRSLSQEAIARIQRSFALDEQLSASRVNRLIQEALDSGPDEMRPIAERDPGLETTSALRSF
jgi:hypothetical protein